MARHKLCIIIIIIIIIMAKLVDNTTRLSRTEN